MNSLSTRPLQHRYGEANRELVGVIVSVNLDRQRLTLIDGTWPAQRLRHLSSSPSCVQRDTLPASYPCALLSALAFAFALTGMCGMLGTVVVWHLEQ
jgi:hypothetical protein